MFKSTETLYADLAKTLGVAELPADASGSLELTIGDDSTVILFAEDEYSLMLVAPVMPLPANLDYGLVLWLMRRNFYDSPLAPFRVSCDAAGTLVLWGRVPIEGMSGAALGSLIEALAAQSNLVREELGFGGDAAAEAS
ncbi:type III secretion system chaperone [Roseateles toxinivorans]|uniref:Tir chaperone family protein CesT n=1 Tax=Roseateles toxinivorans TaxID=270368 RepID=A0A4R6QNG6_9BURK|nr:type III secretion system chaperone [Roseateles toxinivorans]TDP71535.1 Tir chaperone family protein CesT [Roseateles toxinivorans]